MNYFILDTQSNLILAVVPASQQPANDKKTRFLKANPKTLSKYYKLADKRGRKGTLVDIGELAKASPHFQCLLTQTR